MAIVIPDDISGFQVPPGERIFHSFLKTVFSSHPDVVAWHSVRVIDKEIDFALLLPRVGLFVVEVKDWELEKILECGPKTWKIFGEGKTRTNPYEQAWECNYKIREAIEQEPLLINPSGDHQGRSILPVGLLVVFSNISRDAALKCPHSEQFDFRKTLFRDDLEDSGSYLKRPAEGASAFIEFAKGARTVHFPCRPLNGPQMEALKKRVFSDSVVTFATPEPGQITRRIGEVALDHLQEKYAREMGGGPRLLKGIVGSGKTLLLVHRAIILARYQSSSRRVLFTCYNLSLANHVRDMLKHNLPEDRLSRVIVQPYFELCGEILGEPVEHEGRQTSYYDDLTVRAEARVRELPEGEKYEILLIDEGQDFSPGMFKVILGMIRNNEKDIVVAVDAEQDLYGRFSLKKFGIDFRGRVHTLPASYRSTQQIFEFAHRIAGKELPASMDMETGQMFIFPQYVGRSGPEPSVETFGEWNKLVSVLVQRIREKVEVDRFPFAEIAVLYLSPPRQTASHSLLEQGRKRTITSLEGLSVLQAQSIDGRKLAGDIRQGLSSIGIPANWFTENSQAKTTFDLHEPTVKIGTIHSAKGMDFEVVYLIDATGNTVVFPKKGITLDDKESRYRNLLFVGCTRARDQLSLFRLQGNLQ